MVLVQRLGMRAELPQENQRSGERCRACPEADSTEVGSEKWQPVSNDKIGVTMQNICTYAKACAISFAYEIGNDILTQCL